MTKQRLEELAERCPQCRDEPQPGYIEWLNNGPITLCGVCNGTALTAAALRVRTMEK